MLRSRLAPLALAALLWPLAPEAQTSFFPSAPVVPEVVGAGGAAVAAPTLSPFAVFYNPALLADAGVRPGLRVGVSAGPALYGNDDLLTGTGVGSIGLKTAAGGRPLYVTLAGGYREVNIDNVPLAVGDFDTEDRAYGGGLAVGWEGPVTVRAGAAAFARDAPEQPAPVSGELRRDRAVTLRLGTAVTVPLLQGPAIGQAGPRAAVTLGVAHRGAELQSDFFERGPLESGTPEGVEASTRYGASADVALVRRFGVTGRIAFARLNVRAEQRTEGPGSDHVGGAFTLAETVTLRAGIERSDRDGTGETTRTGVGLGVSVDGLVRAVGALNRSAQLLAIADRLTLRGDLARYDAGGPLETDYAGFTVGWRP